MCNIDPGQLTPAIGVAVDTVGFSRKEAHAQRDVPERILAVMEKTLADINIQYDDLLYRDRAGDGMYVFLPPGTDPTRALPGLLTAAATRLADDNLRFRDQIRARMAIGFGLVGGDAGSLAGQLIIGLSRLVDNPPIREAVDENPSSDLVALVSDELHKLAVPTKLALKQVEVVVKKKGFDASAWLWVSPPR